MPAEAGATRRPPVVSWAVVAARLADMMDQGVFVLDGEGRIASVNAAMEEIAGWRSRHLVGRRWVDACVAPKRALAAATALRAAMTGKVARGRWPARTRRGRDVTLHMSTRSCGKKTPGLVCLVWNVEVEASCPSCDDADYEVDIDAGPEGFGCIRRVGYGPAELTDPKVLGRPCHEVIYGRTAACTDCPALSPDSGPRIRVSEQPEPPGGYRATIAAPAGPRTTRVTSLRISGPLLKQLLQAKLQTLERQARLSPRERAVLSLVVQGHALADIGAMLGISARTAKYHQGNLLAKLGADSRSDLLRLLL